MLKGVFSAIFCFLQVVFRVFIVRQAVFFLSLQKIMHNRIALLFALLGTALSIMATEAPATACPLVKVKVERLADLNHPRSGHSVLCLGSEMMVAGGHTTGFIPTPTAEYLSHGKWHELPMLYNHDDGLALVLHSGKVMLAGGHKEPLGIGQTFPIEMYDPATHTFEGIGSLDRSRSLCQALEIDSGRVVIAGNWYADDGIELFDGKKTSAHANDVSTGRAAPFIFRIAPDDVFIVGSLDVKGAPTSTPMVERLRGEPFADSLLSTWHPLPILLNNPGADFIGDASQGVYAHLVVLENDEGQMALAKVSKSGFELLPTACPIPTRSRWGDINYYSPLVVDPKAHRSYLAGTDAHRRLYVLCFGYGHYEDLGSHSPTRSIPLTLYYTDPLPPDCGFAQPVLTAEGNLLFAGGTLGNNFQPMASVFLLRFGQSAPLPGLGGAWLWGAIVLLVGLAAGAWWHVRRRRHRQDAEPELPAEVTTETHAKKHDALMERICQVMEQEKLYLRSDLKVYDVAALLRTNSRYVSDCIKHHEGVSFTYFVNRYRVEHAMSIMKANPNSKITTIYIDSGFANESSFFRAFKLVTGQTPREWQAERHRLHDP